MYLFTQVTGPGLREECLVEGLTPKKKYRFRVKAYNREGESDPLEGDEPVLARNPYGSHLNTLLVSWFIICF